MTAFKPTYKPFGERSILVEWPQVIDKNILKDIINFKEKIKDYNIEYLIEVISAYNSLLVTYKEFKNDFNEEVEFLKEIYQSDKIINKIEARLWKIPVCYDTFFGIDLEDISQVKGLTKEKIIQLHFEAIYTVYFIGFLPGFLYLGGLNEALHFPRKSTPRLLVPKGAVAIGGNQTGVYPSESPGGWNIIGNTPLSFFDVSKEIPCFAKPGDSIMFYSVSIKEYEHIKALVEINSFELESEVIDD